VQGTDDAARAENMVAETAAEAAEAEPPAPQTDESR
jgi:hypothetical protein